MLKYLSMRKIQQLCVHIALLALSTETYVNVLPFTIMKQIISRFLDNHKHMLAYRCANKLSAKQHDDQSKNLFLQHSAGN